MATRTGICLLSALLCGILPASPLPAAPVQWSWSGVDRIVAVGDLHGDYDKFVAVLQSAGLINRKADWIGGKAHLVQLGDVPDRGPHPRRIMDLLMKLEKQAQRAGGQVHALIGNHETMNIYGDLRYTTPKEFEEFRDARSERIRQHYYDQVVMELRKKAEAEGSKAVIDEAFRQKWEAEHPLGWVEQRFAYGPNGEYGTWIRSHNAVIRIDDTLFVHAGISQKYADMPPELINDRVRKELEDFALLEGGIVRDPEGPLWYRGMAEGDEQELAPQVEAALKSCGVKRVVIGHTPTRTTVIPRFGCSVIQADVGLSEVYGGPPACLVIEGGTAFALHRGKKLQIPCDGGQGLLDYLQSAAALDPQPSPIQKAIQELEKKLDATQVKQPAGAGR